MMKVADRDGREGLHSLGFDDDQEFFAAYAKAHKASTGEEFIPWIGGAW